MGDIVSLRKQSSADSSALLRAIVGVARTDIGETRDENQDSCLIVENDQLRLYVVADGMGGASGGKHASQRVVDVIQETVLQQLEAKQPLDHHTFFTAIESAHRAIHDDARSDPSLFGMGTTMVLLAFVEEAAYVINIGDSRAYLVRGGKIQQLTEDHSVAAELVRAGTLSADQADQTPVSHMLTRNLGSNQGLEVDCWRITGELYQQDLFVLCSDGLHGQISEEYLLSSCLESDSARIADTLVKRANDYGGEDNVTVILVRINAPFHAAEANHGQPLKMEKLALPIIPAQQSSSDLRSYASLSSVSDLPSPSPMSSVSSAPSLGSRRRWIVIVAALSACFIVGVLVGRSAEQRASTEVTLQQESSPDIASDGSREKATNASASAILPTTLPGPVENLDLLAPDQLVERLERVRLELDVSTRRLAIWAARQGRIQVDRPSLLSAEVAALSTTLQAQIARYQDFHRQYLKAAENLVYNPFDVKQEQKVAELARQDQRLLDELDSAIREAIDYQLQSIIGEISVLSQQRDRLQVKIEQLRKENG